MIDNLKRTEHAATIFCKMNEPPAPIEWLPVLEKEGLLEKLRTDEKDFLFQNSSNNNLIPLHQTTKSLWGWLAEHHLESKQFVEWTIEKSANLHPDFIQLIKNKLYKQSLKKPYLTFWRLIVLNQNHCVFSDGFHELHDLELSRDSLNLLSLSKLFEPKIQFSKVFSYEDKKISKPYDAEVVIEIDSYYFEEITQYADELTSMLLPITNSLKQAMEFWELLGQANNEFDLSHWYLVSISPHSQNQSHHSWCYLIEFCRDLWNATYKKDKSLALVILELWKTIPFPIFRRLVFHAYTIQDETTASEKLNYLLADDAWWFWSVETTREKFRLLASLCPQLTTDELNRLEQTIITGAPRNKYRDDLSEKDFKKLNDRQIWLHLAKLKTFDVSLSKPTKSFYKSLSKNHPELRLQEDDRDEFTRWHSSWIGNKCDLAADELIALSVEKRIEKLLEPSAEYSEGRIDLFRNICKDKPGIALETLNLLAIQSNWNEPIWHAGLVGLSDSDNSLWLEIAKLIVQFPNELIKVEAWAIAWWMKKAIEPVNANSNEAYFWEIFDLLIINIKPIAINSADIISQATNHPIGILTDVLIDRIATRSIKNKGTINNKFLSCLNKLLDSKNEVFSLARVILLSRLNYFHAIDPEWTKTNLIPLLDWDLSNDAGIYWQGYLWNPKISADLALDLKKHLLTTLIEHSNKLGETTAQLFQLFTLICLEYQNFYNEKEQKDVLESIDKEGLIEIAKFIYHSLGDDKESNDKFWKNRIEPFFKTAWPKQAESLDPKISEYFVLMCIKLDIEFKSAVDSIKIVLTSFNCSRLFLKQLQDSQHITKHSLSILELLRNVRVEQWGFKKYQEIMRSLAEHAPSLRQDSEFQKIEQFLIRKIGNT